MKHSTWYRSLIVVALTLAIGAGTMPVYRAGAQEGVEVGASQATPGAAVAEPSTILAGLTGSITYQGRLAYDGSPADGLYDFEFTLYDAETLGSRVNGATRDDVVVSDGFFTVELYFGGDFDGQALWLAISVRPGSSTGSYTDLTPRQPITAAPYAHGLRPGAEIEGSVGFTIPGPDPIYGGWPALSVTNETDYDGGSGVSGHASATSGKTYGVQGIADSPEGVGVYGRASTTSGWNAGVRGENYSTSGTGVYGRAYATTGWAYGVHGETDSTEGKGVFGYARATTGTSYGVCGASASPDGRGVVGLAAATSGEAYGVKGTSNSPDGVGVYGTAPHVGVEGYASATTPGAYGVKGTSEGLDGVGVYGYGRYAVWGEASGAGPGVYGEGDFYGVKGYASRTGDWSVAVVGESAGACGVVGTAEAYGVMGTARASDGTGVHGVGPAYGVEGHATATSGYTYGVWGESWSTTGRGVIGLATASSGITHGVHGRSDSPSGYGGYFVGDVHVNGDLSASGEKPFKIDHPLDPAGQYLYHFSQEAPEVQNVYNGVAVLDAHGQALVTLPAYFAALNTGPYRYQLTPVGAPMPDLYIAQEIEEGTFQIAGGAPGMKVSWEVTAVRNDPYVRDHPIETEQTKPEDEQGKYLYPQGYGQPEELWLEYMPEVDRPEVEEGGPGW